MANIVVIEVFDKASPWSIDRYETLPASTSIAQKNEALTWLTAKYEAFPEFGIRINVYAATGQVLSSVLAK